CGSSFGLGRRWKCSAGGLRFLFQQRQAHVDADFFVQPTEHGLGGGEGPVLEELVRWRSAATEGEILAALAAHCDAPANLLFQQSKAWRGDKRIQAVRGHVPQRESTMRQAGDAEQFGRVGAEVSLTIDVDNGPRPVFLSACARSTAMRSQ